MTPLASVYGRRARRALVSTALVTFGAACDEPFEPFQESRDGAFSIVGYLNSKADTQWVRVMPVRQSLFLEPEPIDAVVTLEHVATGRTVAMNDSLFAFRDAQLDATAYAYNFWTTEPIEPEATYRVRAVRSDGAAATATVTMPPALEMTYLTGPAYGLETALLRIRAPRVLLAEVNFAMMDTAGRRAQSIVISQEADFATDTEGIRGLVVDGDTLIRPALLDARRQEIRLVVVPADWPFDSDMPDLDIALPGTAPSNVDNGLGYVAGVAAWTIPFHRCLIRAGTPPDDAFCATTVNGQSASVVGRLRESACGGSNSLVEVLLTETAAGGRTQTRWWKSGWDGSFRFEGIEPGAELYLQLGIDGPVIPLPALRPGERYRMEDIAVPCETAA